jgi:type II secretion system protein J
MLTSHQSQAQRGFTLIEIVIAVALTAVVALLSLQALDSLTKTSESLQKQYRDLSRIERVFSIIEGDISHLLSPYYIQNMPYIAIGSNDEAKWLGLMRTQREKRNDWTGKLTTQLVLYRLKQNRLERLVSEPTSQLLPNSITTENQLLLLENVKKIEWFVPTPANNNILTEMFYQVHETKTQNREKIKPFFGILGLIAKDTSLAQVYDPLQPRYIEVKITLEKQEQEQIYTRTFLVGYGV